MGRTTRISYFHMGTEYLECGACHKKYATNSFDMLNQLDITHISVSSIAHAQVLDHIIPCVTTFNVYT